MSDDHSSFARGYGFSCIKTIDGGIGLQRPDQLPTVSGWQRVRGVLDHIQTVLPGNFDDRVHVTGQAREMHRQDRFGSWGDGAFDLLRGEIECLGIYINEDRMGSEMADDTRR